jgi:drug/metabolite transporter (DMT)-like permease
MKNKKTITSSKSRVESLFLVIIALAVIFWAFAFPVITVALEELNPENLAILRLFIASLIFFGYFVLKKETFSSLNKSDIPWLFLLGFVGISMYHLSINYGELYVSAGTASLIIATIPLFVVILASIFLKEHITLLKILGIIVSLVGVIIISLWGTPGITIEIIYLSAAAAILLASFVGAIYTIGGKKLMKRYSPLSLTTYAFLFGNLGLLVFIRPLFFEQVINLSWQVWVSVLFLAIFPTVLAYSFWYAALEVKPASELTVYLYFTPVISTLVSCLFFEESITIFYIIGGFLVILGLYIVNMKKQKLNHIQLKSPQA